MSYANSHLLLLTLVAALTGCGGTSTPESAVSATTASVNGEKFLLADEPDGAIGVIEARDTAEDGQPIVIVGRIGGAENPWIEGRAAFTLLDASMALVADGTESEEGEICLGDCCAEERGKCTTLVKVVDADGKLVAADSRKLLGVTEADTVVVQGKASKDESGNFTVLAQGVFVRR
jgi:hypothetical protein